MAKTVDEIDLNIARSNDGTSKENKSQEKVVKC